MRTILALLICSIPAAAQVTATVGPAVAPVGCPISITIANDTPAMVWTGECPFVVRGTNGMAVYDPFCPLRLRGIPAGGTFTVYWHQDDGTGVPLPPGRYVVEVKLPDGSWQKFPVDVSTSAQAALATLGPVRPGVTRTVYLCAPAAGGDTYVLAASLSRTPGLPTCGGTLPLVPDALLFASLQPGNGLFGRFTGQLDPQGGSVEPTIAMPPVTGLRGLPFYTAFVAVDFSQPCPVTAVSESLPITVQ